MNPSPRILAISVVVILLAVAARQQVQIERLEDRMEGLSAEARERVVSGDGKEDVIRMPGAPGAEGNADEGGGPRDRGQSGTFRG
ncbi:MAG: hypothetical protein O3C21_19240 [Verrucomicrobia bacterium]|nr:hypothetical protein [Verrucomicrobiota bacterium]